MKGKATPHWTALVKTFFDYHIEHYKRKPLFKGVHQRNLKLIVDALQHEATEANMEWTEETAVRMLTRFFDVARSITFFQNAFELNVLYSKYNSIVNHARNNRATGSKVTTESILSTIAAMPD